MKISKYYLLLLAGMFTFITTTAYFAGEKSTRESLSKLFSSPQASSIKYRDHSKIIKFNHKLHIKDAGIACKDCHTAASQSVSAKDNLNPLMQNCASCHDVKDEKNCKYCHFDNIQKKLKPSTSELIFSHKYHVETQKKACTDCHTGIEQVKYAKESAGAFPVMQTCSTCHSSGKAAMNCEACHTNLTGLTPKDHKQKNFLNEHKVVSTSSSSNCMMCHSDNFCQVCHSPVNYSGDNKKEDFYVPFYTKEGATRIDRTALQKLTTVHELNYRFTHGLDASHKSFECKTCHDPVTFCAPCHQNRGDLITGIAPQSHLQPNFTTIGVNTGGGLHSDLARKDIESCQSCHDVQGGDPTCVKCHFDNDGVKGTNPRTHEPGFLSDEKGLWHDTQGAICYICHTDANAKPGGLKGIGFCGYCHENEGEKK